MAKVCYQTQKDFMSGNKRSHAMNASRRRWKANLQKVRIIDEKGKVKTVYMSARALKKMKFERA